MLVERGFSVCAISDDGTAERCHVNTNLVRAPRFDSADNGGDWCLRAFGEDLPVCYGDLSVLLDDRHSLSVHWVPTDEVFDSA